MRGITWSIVCLATVLLHTAIFPEHSMADNGAFLLEGAAVLGLSVAWAYRHRRIDSKLLPWSCVLFIAAGGLMPFFTEPLKRMLSGLGSSYETQAMFSMRNLALALAASSAHGSTCSLAALVSLFVALLSFLMPCTALTILLLAAYSLSAVYWLIAAHWQTIAGQMIHESRRLIPHRAAATSLVIVSAVCIASAAAARGMKTHTALAGFFPTSGGVGTFDPFARRGVGDGDQLVKAEESAMSFGPIDTDLFLESKEASLFDMFQDMYDTPVVRNQKTERSIGLPYQEMPKSPTRIATSEKAGREFETVRQSHRPKQAMDDRKSPDVLQVIGRTPLHLRTHVYNAWDGTKWRWIGGGGLPELTIEYCNDKPWLTAGASLPTKPNTQSVSHVVRYLKYTDSRLALPPHTARLRIDRVDRADLFARTDDGGIRLDRRCIPSLTVVHYQSTLPDQQWLRTLSFAEARYGQAMLKNNDLRPGDRSSTSTSNSKLHQLARQWTAGTERGWTQIRAIAGKLQSEYRLAPQVTVPAEADNSVAWFLTQSKCGPDYLFASAGVVLLRELGYHARLASGFYARPEKADPRTEVTSIGRDDLHFWCEASPDGANWFVVECTPGYSELLPAMGLWARIQLNVRDLFMWLMRYRELSLAVLFAGLLLLWQSRRLKLLARWCWYLWSSRRSCSRQHVLAAWQLVEERFRFERQPRPGPTPLGRWYQQTNLATAVPEWPRFVTLVQWAQYADSQPCPASGENVRAVCESVCRTVAPFRSSVNPRQSYANC